METLRGLRRLELDAESIARITEHMCDGAFSTGWLAADIAGEKGIMDAVPALREAMRSEDPLLAGKAMLNLARLGDADSFDDIRGVSTNVLMDRA